MVPVAMTIVMMVPMVPVVMMVPMVPVVMMVIVICFDDFVAITGQSFWNWRNGRSVGRPVSGHESERRECRREDYSLHFLTSLAI